MQLVGNRQTENICQERAIKRRQQRSRHERTELGRIGHVGEHLHHSDQGADHAERRRTIADRAVDFLALVEMRQEVVTVAFKIVADELGLVAVGDEADAFGEERVLDFDLFESDRPLLARDFGKSGDLVDELALGRAPHGEGKSGPQRQPVKNRIERKADQRRGKRSTENDDDRVFAQEHR